VGAGVGVMLDRWLETSPFLMILCLCFGTAAGVKTMLASVRQLEAEQVDTADK
jgi:F0F1-type ATP synthase assembly protein I